MDPPFVSAASSIHALAEDIERCMLVDRPKLHARLRGLRAPTALAAFQEDVARALAKVAYRVGRVPTFTYPDELPIAQRKGEIAAAIRDHQVVIVCGETGSGKTTQLPKICLELGRGIVGMIGHTQPRRIAARTIAARLASELGDEVGRGVGFKVRFTDRVGPDSYIKVMTDGILLAETQGDRQFLQYDTLIIDEAHERSLNIDFLLGYLKRLLPERPDLKVIVTSATIDPQRFAEHFSGAPIVEVSGRSFPVELRYRPLTSDDPEMQDRDLQEAIIHAVDELAAIDHGDILVFLSGERDIRETAEALRKHHPPHTEIVPLYARLSAGEQGRVFQSHTGRRIVLATNVAETSLTVPGIRYVVDSGFARIGRYDPRMKVQRLPIERTSQASANQRAGRCGRTSAGVCIRLYAEEDFASRAEFTQPEILRANLASVILQMAALGLGHIEQFPFLEPPDRRSVRDGHDGLIELGAIDEEYRLTDIGRKLARLPIDPRFARMILAAEANGCVRDVLVIAAALSVQDPRERPLDSQQRADDAHRRFQDDTSDFASFLKLWDAYHDRAKHLTQSKLRKFCEDSFVSYMRMRDWSDIHRQLFELVTEMGFTVKDGAAPFEALHRSLLTGLLGNVALKGDDQTYLGARNVRLALFPGSGLFKKRPPWIMAAELVETGRLYARVAAKIEPEWIEPVASHLVRRSYFEPHWEKNRGQVVGFERVSLYGLPVIAKRKIDFAKVDPVTSREIFLRDGLVAGELRTTGAFLKHNQELIASIEGIEARTRRRDILVDEQAVFAFYDKHVPDDVASLATFEHWRKGEEREQPQLLYLNRADLLAGEDEFERQAFPDVLELDGNVLPLTYRFEPGHPEDGVTVTLPIGYLGIAHKDPFEWIVPGLVREKIVELVEGLPKGSRRLLVPISEAAKLCADELQRTEGSLGAALSAYFERSRGVKIPIDAWRMDSCVPYLQMGFRLVGDQGQTLGYSRSLEELQRSFMGRVRPAASQATTSPSPYDREGVTAWEFGDLPEHVEVRQGGVVLRGYPALVDESGKIALRVIESPVVAALRHRAGLRRLLLLGMGESAKYLRRSLPEFGRLSIAYAPLGSGDDLRDDLLLASVDRACLGDGALARTRREFDERLKGGQVGFGAVVAELCGRVLAILTSHHALKEKLSKPSASGSELSRVEIVAHLGTLVDEGFVRRTTWGQLLQFPRYLRAAELRLERMRQDPRRDRERSALLATHWTRFLERRIEHTSRGIEDPELERYRWLLEEWRVSIFAQELKTAESVSAKRLDDQWQRVSTFASDRGKNFR